MAGRCGFPSARTLQEGEGEEALALCRSVVFAQCVEPGGLLGDDEGFAPTPICISSRASFCRFSKPRTP